ncbi:MAG: 3-hydroxyacyl-ACP dehydratase FabZ family protein [Verrucomicrobiota bacterium]
MSNLVDSIPHKPPFRFIDEVTELREDGATAIRTLQPDEFYFAGHYPGNPIMPGVLLSEAAFQTAAVYLAKRLAGEGINMAERTPILSRISDAKFKNMVRPGETITIDVTYQKTMADFHFLRGTVRRGDGKVAVALEFVLALVEASP